MRRHHLSWVPLPEAPPQYAKAEGTSVMEESCEAKARTSTEEPVCFEYVLKLGESSRLIPIAVSQFLLP